MPIMLKNNSFNCSRTSSWTFTERALSLSSLRIFNYPFQLINSLLKNYRPNIYILLSLCFLEDLSLVFFSWSPDILSGHSTWAQYIFNPIYYLIDKYTSTTYAFFLSLILLWATCFMFCLIGLASNRIKANWPIKALGILTALQSTILVTPTLLTLVTPVICENG
jgi:hypothetical protein